MSVLWFVFVGFSVYALEDYLVCDLELKCVDLGQEKANSACLSHGMGEESFTVQTVQHCVKQDSDFKGLPRKKVYKTRSSERTERLGVLVRMLCMKDAESCDRAQKYWKDWSRNLQDYEFFHLLWERMSRLGGEFQNSKLLDWIWDDIEERRLSDKEAIFLHLKRLIFFQESEHEIDRLCAHCNKMGFIRDLRKFLDQGVLYSCRGADYREVTQRALWKYTRDRVRELTLAETIIQSIYNRCGDGYEYLWRQGRR